MPTIFLTRVHQKHISKLFPNISRYNTGTQVGDNK